MVVNCISKIVSPFIFKNINSFNKYTFFRNIMDLNSVIKVIETALPPELAEKWDKTGLLIKPECNIEVSSILFTIDLTEAVLEEAIALQTNMIIAYHPPIFSPMQKLLSDNWKDRIVMKCVRHSVAVYSPHTICDIVKGGVNDWLIRCFDVCDIKAIASKQDHSDVCSMFELTLPISVDMKTFANSYVDFKVIAVSQFGDLRNVKLITTLSQSYALQLLSAHPKVEFVSVHPAKRNDSLKGVGRIAKLKEPITLIECVNLVKNYLNLQNIRFAMGVNHTIHTKIETIAVCAGSGASVLKDVTADLYFTGEMSHHEVLHATHRNTSVLLVEHSNSERGYLGSLVNLLQPQLRNISLRISNSDRDPICIV